MEKKNRTSGIENWPEKVRFQLSALAVNGGSGKMILINGRRRIRL